MTTIQIIILLVLFVIDFYFSIVRNLYKNNDYLGCLLQAMRMGLTWSIIITFMVSTNRLSEQIKSKCPEYELIQEPIYKLKP